MQLSLLIIINKPTRITDNYSATLIDNVFINETCNSDSGRLISDISHHFPFFLLEKISATNSSKNANKSVHYRLVNRNTLSVTIIGVFIID